MQKLPEAPDRKRGGTCTKEKEPSWQKERILCFFNSDQWSDNT